MDIQEETLGETRRHQWTKDPRLKEATSSEGTPGRIFGKTIGLEVVSWDFQQDLKNE
jgi:hypothetical protein